MNTTINCYTWPFMHEWKTFNLFKKKKVWNNNFVFTHFWYIRKSQWFQGWSFSRLEPFTENHFFKKNFKYDLCFFNTATSKSGCCSWYRYRDSFQYWSNLDKLIHTSMTCTLVHQVSACHFLQFSQSLSKLCIWFPSQIK